MLPEIQSLINGAQRGKMQFAGAAPTGINVGGAPANNFDPLDRRWKDALTGLSALSDALHQQRREGEANKVAKLAVQLQHLSLEARKKIAENSSGTGSAAESGLAAAGGINAQGIPSGV